MTFGWLPPATRTASAIILAFLLASCSSAPAVTPFWYRIYEVDPQTGEAIGKTYTCHLDEKGKTKCWEEAR